MIAGAAAEEHGSSLRVSLCTMDKLQQAMITSAHLLEQPALPEGVKARGLGCSYMELGIVQSIW